MAPEGKRYITHSSRNDVFAIYNLADLHVGNAACAMGKLKADIKAIKDDPYSFWVGGGDYADYISRKDRRYDPSCLDPSITVKDMGALGRKLATMVRDLLWPIRDKCLGLVYGNHEDKYMNDCEQQDLHAWLCTELSVPNLRYSAIFDLIFVRRPTPKPALYLDAKLGGKRNCNNYASHKFRIYIHHGAGSASTPAGKLTKLIQFMNMFIADIYMVGHVHDRAAKRHVRIGADDPCRSWIQKEMVGTITGSYLKTYDDEVVTYGEKKAYPPAILGASFVRITPDKGTVTAEV